MSENKPISFRLAPEHRELLEDFAEEHGLSSPDLAARKMVLDRLDSEGSDSLGGRLEVLITEIEEIRTDLSVATEALLGHGGKLTEAEATEWVNTNLKAR